MSDFFSGLLTSDSKKQVQPEMLETLGKKASQEYIGKNTSLNDSIARIVSDNPNLTNEHIKRVIEFANNYTFQKLFENSEDKNIHFPVADPGVIFRDLQDGGSPEFDGRDMLSSSDYTDPPKPSSVEASEPEGTEKTASLNTPPSFGHANPIEDVYDSYVILKEAKSKLEGEMSIFEGIIKEAKDSFNSYVKHEILEGVGLGSVRSALEKVAEDTIEIDTLLSPVVEDLITKNQLTNSDAKQSFEKIAGVMVNDAHPLITSYAAIVKCANEYRKTELALEDVSSSFSEVEQFLRKAI